MDKLVLQHAARRAPVPNLYNLKHNVGKKWHVDVTPSI